jgi:hypothetical protein
MSVYRHESLTTSGWGVLGGQPPQPWMSDGVDGAAAARLVPSVLNALAD